MRHQGFILATLFSADGARLYSGSVEGVVNVWDVATGSLLNSWECHDGPILDLQRSPDGGQLLTASKDRTVGVWDAETGTLINRLSGHGGGVFCVGASHGRIASGCFDGSIRIWDWNSGKHLDTLSGHTDAVTTLAFLSQGLSQKRIVSGSRDRTVKVWNLTSATCVHTLEGHRHWVTKIRALPDRQCVLSAGEDGRCKLWDCETGSLIWSRTLESRSPIWGLDVAPSGEFAIAGAGPTRLSLASGEAEPLEGVRDLGCRAIAISPVDGLTALGSDDGNIALYDTGRSEVVNVLRGASLGGLSLAVGNADESIATGHADGAIEVRSKDGTITTHEHAHGTFVYTVCRVGEHGFASGAFDGIVRVWNFRTQELLHSLTHGGLIFSLSSSPDGRYLLSGGSDAIRLWDLETASVITDVDAIGSGAHTIAALAPDLIVSAGDDAVLRCWEPAGKPIRSHQLEDDATSVLKLLPDNRRAVIGNAYGRVSVIDLASGNVERLHERHEDWIRGGHVSPDGRYVVTVSQDCECYVYDLVANRLLSLDALQVPIPAASIDDTGQIIALTAEGEIARANPSGD